MHRELPLQRRLDAHNAQRVNGRLREEYPNQLFSWMSMFRFGRDKATEISRWRRSQDFSVTAGIDAKLPERPSLEGYKVEVLSLDSVVHFFKTHGNYRDQFAQSHRAALRASESEFGKQLAPK